MLLLASGVFLFFSFGSHFLIMIISLEVTMLSVIMIFILLQSPTSGMYYFMLFIVLVVCMGSYGVTMLLNFYRLTGSDISFN